MTSILWSITIHIISGDFYHGILGAKLAFRERDFRQMDEHSKEIFYGDLYKLLNETYTEPVVEDEAEDVTTLAPLDANGNRISVNFLSSIAYIHTYFPQPQRNSPK